MSLPEKLRGAREDAGWSRKTLIDRLVDLGHKRVSETFIGMVEDGRRPPSFELLDCYQRLFEHISFSPLVAEVAEIRRVSRQDARPPKGDPSKAA